MTEEEQQERSSGAPAGHEVPAVAGARKPYSEPVLTRHGTIEELTLGNGGPGAIDEPIFDPLTSGTP